MAAAEEQYDRLSELKAFDETKTGAKGLSDSGLAVIPRFFHNPFSSLPVSAGAIPTIDLRRPIGDLVAEIRAAAADWGFFQVVGHGVPLEAMDGMIRGVAGFFEGDVEEKKRFHSRDSARKVRYNCNFDLFTSTAANWRDTLALSMAPEMPEPHEIPMPLREPCMEYWKHAAKLGEHLFELLSQALGLNPSYLNDIGCSKGHLILAHYYPRCPQPELTLGASPHSDHSFLTVLLQDQLGGLQVLRDNQWVEVNPLPGALVVNIGDLLQLISNDRFVSVEHRVVANKRSRVSVAFFFTTHFDPSLDVSYGPIEELLSEDSPPLYKKTLVRDYLAHYFRKGLSGKSPLADFRL